MLTINQQAFIERFVALDDESDWFEPFRECGCIRKDAEDGEIRRELAKLRKRPDWIAAEQRARVRLGMRRSHDEAEMLREARSDEDMRKDEARIQLERASRMLALEEQRLVADKRRNPNAYARLLKEFMAEAKVKPSSGELTKGEADDIFAKMQRQAEAKAAAKRADPQPELVILSGTLGHA